MSAPVGLCLVAKAIMSVGVTRAIVSVRSGRRLDDKREARAATECERRVFPSAGIISPAHWLRAREEPSVWGWSIAALASDTCDDDQPGPARGIGRQRLPEPMIRRRSPRPTAQGSLHTWR